MKEKLMYVYILASCEHGTLYTGVTNNLFRRVPEHKNKIFKGFTSKYSVFRLVYYECFGNALEAIAREKVIKKYPRKKKIDLIEQDNPRWQDLYDDLCENGVRFKN